MTHMRPVTERCPANPLDVVEGLATFRDWDVERRGKAELAIEAEGRWCDYSLYFAWSEDIAALHFTCAFDMRVPDDKAAQVVSLLALINEKLWLGHFGLWEDEGLPLFRHTQPLRGLAGASLEQMEDVVETALAECDRFYPAFQFVLFGGKTAAEAVSAALVDTVGEA